MKLASFIIIVSIIIGLGESNYIFLYENFEDHSSGQIRKTDECLITSEYAFMYRCEVKEGKHLFYYSRGEDCDSLKQTPLEKEPAACIEDLNEFFDEDTIIERYFKDRNCKEFDYGITLLKRDQCALRFGTLYYKANILGNKYTYNSYRNDKECNEINRIDLDRKEFNTNTCTIYNGIHNMKVSFVHDINDDDDDITDDDHKSDESSQSLIQSISLYVMALCVIFYSI